MTYARVNNNKDNFFGWKSLKYEQIAAGYPLENP